MNWSLEDERVLWADVCRKSMWWFCVVAMGMEHFPKAHRWFHEYMQRPLCDWYEGHVKNWLADRDKRGEPRQTCLMILIPREFAKTSIITQAGQLWLHVNDPDLATATGSETTGLAQEIIGSIKTIIAGKDPHAWFTWLYGNWYDKGRKWRDEFVVHGARRAVARKDPSFNTWGVATGLLGKHPDALFFDDPISYDAIAADSLWVEKVNAHVNTLLPVQRADSLIVWVGTRYGDGDHFGTQFRVNGALSLAGMPHPSMAQKEDGKWHVYYLQARDKRDTKDDPKGRPVFPEQWPSWRLLENERMDQQKYASQLMNDPSSSEYNPLTQPQIDECYVEEKNIPYNILRYTMHLDVAFKVPKRQYRGDESVIQIWGHQVGTGNVWFIEGYSSNAWRSEDFYKEVGTLLQKYYYKKRKVLAITAELEPGGMQGTVNSNIINECNERNIPIPAYYTLSRAGKDKGRRMIEPCGYWVNGFVKLRKGAPGVDRLTDQMVRLQTIIIENGHDDWADVAADVFHPKVYIPLKRHGLNQDTAPARQLYDAELGVKRTILDLYDEYTTATEDRPTYDPI